MDQTTTTRADTLADAARAGLRTLYAELPEARVAHVLDELCRWCGAGVEDHGDAEEMVEALARTIEQRRDEQLDGWLADTGVAIAAELALLGR